jgi:hypothetical protein
MRIGPIFGRRGPGLLGTMATTALVAGAATVAVKGVGSMMGGSSQKKAAAAQQQDLADLQTQQAQLAAQQKALAQEQATAAQQAAAPQAAPAPPWGSLDDQRAQILKLSVMKDRGLITEQEFTAKKKQILRI